MITDKPGSQNGKDYILLNAKRETILWEVFSSPF